MTATAAWGMALLVLVLFWFAAAVLLGFSLAATGKRLAALQTAIEAHRKSEGSGRDDIALYEAAGLDVLAPPTGRPGERTFIRGERFR